MDLFVWKSNVWVINFYKGMGYSVYWVVKDYYGDYVIDLIKDGEDVFDMCKLMKRDKNGKYVRMDGEKYEVYFEDVW